MMRVVKVVVGLLLIGLGGPLLFLGLIRLGWRRHGASPLDVSFLHLDWTYQPQLPYWFAHMANLALASVGLVAVVAGVGVLLRQLLAPGHTQ